MRLILGTAQFGLDYGVTNQSGKVSDIEMEKILKCGLDNGIQYLDTASAYGNSEIRIADLGYSEKFKIITKIPSMLKVKKTESFMYESLDLSLSNLKVSKLDTLMLHDQNDLSESNFKILEALKEQGYFDKLGCSFYDVDKANDSVEKFNLDVIQIPGSLLDQRFKDAGLVDRAREKSVEIHCRSLFLQGIILSNPDIRPEKFSKKKDLNLFDVYLKNNKIDRMSMALSPVKSSSFGDYFVVGFTKEKELEQVLASLNHSVNMNYDLSIFKSDDLSLIDPRNWK